MNAIAAPPVIRHTWDACALRLEALAAIGRQRSASLVRFFDMRMELLVSTWTVLIVLAGLTQVLTALHRPQGIAETLAGLLPYLLIAVAPIAGLRIASACFPRGILTAQPAIRLSRVGSWRQLDPIRARRNPAYGPIGLMASLLVGLLLNVPTRTLEYLTAVPAVGSDAPGWAQTYFHVMTADVIALNFFYMVCFVLALRSNPYFPRMLVFTWAYDIAMQMVIARQVALAPDLPSRVIEPLATLLHGNILKVMISVFIWLPYLLLSERVNVTYRSRTSALA
jgi:hypothetical protein